jgi:hypothetical protein
MDIKEITLLYSNRIIKENLFNTFEYSTVSNTDSFKQKRSDIRHVLKTKWLNI